MKKIIIILTSYTVLIFATCIGASFLYGKVPFILGKYSTYMFLRGLLWFFKVLPAILLSGLGISCCVQWKTENEEERFRFSRAMLKRFRNVFFISLGLTFILTLSQEVFIPSVENGLTRREKAPIELENTKNTAVQLFEDNEPTLALQYAKKAMEIAPKDKEAFALAAKIRDSLETQKNKELFQTSVLKNNSSKSHRISKPLAEHDKGYSIYQLIQMSKKAAQEKDWFNAHYYANLAVEACDGTNTNRASATEAANYAWKMLNKPVPEEMSEEAAIFNKKREGYAAYHAGDFLKAYYIFADLKFAKEVEDPDVTRFFALAEEQVENQYFFFDETDNMALMTSNKNIYFSLFNPDGSRNIFFLKGTMDMKKDGGVVRYIEGLNIVNYKPDGKFNYSLYVPYAKVIAQPAKVLNAETKQIMGINKHWKNIPLIQLCSVNRETEDVICEPVISYTESNLPESIKEKFGIKEFAVDESFGQEASPTFLNYAELPENEVPQGKKSAVEKLFENIPDVKVETHQLTKINNLLLPVDYSEFTLISSATNSAKDMSIVNLCRFMPKSVHYGFAWEVYAENFVNRLCFPFYILIMFILIASFGWNFRVSGENTIFKLIWVLIIPIYSAMMFVFYEITQYLFKIINYMLVGALGLGSVFTAIVVYIVLLLLTSLGFCSHKK